MKDSGIDLEYFSFRENYSSSGGSLLEEFYVPALSVSQRYDRATGYFSSAILALAPIAFSAFIAAGGKMRILCSPHLTSTDAEALLNLSEGDRPTSLEVAADSLASLVHGTDVEQRAVTCLRALIDLGALEIKFVTSGAAGLFHDKLGIFTDSANKKVSFIGSANETAAAWSGFMNHEQIEVFCNWLDEGQRRRCDRHEELFEETWLGLRRGLRVTSQDDAAEVVRANVPAQDWEDALPALKYAAESAHGNPSAIGLRDYQEQALTSWTVAEHRGIVAFATGGGKTRTAIEAIRRWCENGNPALILVPSTLLHEQWSLELRGLLPAAAVLHAGAGASREKWAPRLADYSRDDPNLGARIILSTYQTAVTDKFIDLLRDGNHLLVVADEVHRIGASDTRRFMSDVRSGGRMGLSATPDRYGDPEGTAAIYRYFGKILQPEFSLVDALDAGVLVPYEYHFNTCSLSDEESEDWDSLTKRIAQDIARHKGQVSELGLHLLRQRSRIAKRADGKGPIARGIIDTNYKEGDRWLVYCSDINHLNTIREHLGGVEGNILEYHSQNTNHHSAVLDYFTRHGGILLAIKCLDEGIDIPMINKALILASSTNPREYIQRRGRVLRRSPGKYKAVLYDVLVTTQSGIAITPGEAVRAIEFANAARNLAPAFELEELVPSNMEVGTTVPTEFEE